MTCFLGVGSQYPVTTSKSSTNHLYEPVVTSFICSWHFLSIVWWCSWTNDIFLPSFYTPLLLLDFLVVKVINRIEISVFIKFCHLLIYLDPYTKQKYLEKVCVKINFLKEENQQTHQQFFFIISECSDLRFTFIAALLIIFNAWWHQLLRIFISPEFMKITVLCYFVFLDYLISCDFYRHSEWNKFISK